MPQAVPQGTSTALVFEDFKEYAASAEVEQAVATEAIKLWRKQRFEDYKRVQYHTKYADFTDLEKEKNIPKPEKVLERRYNAYQIYCQDAAQNNYPRQAGTTEEEAEIMKQAIIAFRKKRAANKGFEAYRQKVLQLNEKVEYPKYNRESFRDFLVLNRASEIFGKHENGPKAGQSKFVYDAQAKSIINPLCEYFTNDVRFEKRFFMDTDTKKQIPFSLNKGILLFSECGYGKTDTMRLFASNQRQSFKIVNCVSVETDFSMAGDEGIEKYYNTMLNPNPQAFFGHEKFGILFDNFGLEKRGKFYGNEEEVMEKVLFQIYHRKADFMGKVHITTNFGRAYIKERYGPAVYSRFYEMFNFLTFAPGSVDRRLDA